MRTPKAVPELSERDMKRLEQALTQIEGKPECMGARLRMTEYGSYQISIQGTRLYVHRVLYTLENGPIPEDFVLYPLCDTKGCVRPSHWEAMSFMESDERKAERGLRGRGKRGPNKPKAPEHCPNCGFHLS